MLPRCEQDAQRGMGTTGGKTGSVFPHSSVGCEFDAKQHGKSEKIVGIEHIQKRIAVNWHFC